MRTWLIAVMVAVSAGACLAAETPNAVLVLRSSLSVPKALQAFENKFGRQAFDCLISDETLSASRLKQARVLFLEHPSREFLDRLKPHALEAIGKGLQIVTDVPEIVQRTWGIEIAAVTTRKLMPYWQNGGDENMLAFLMAIYREAGGPSGLAIPAPREMPRTGVYHPDAPQLFPDLKTYLEWYRKAKPRQGALATVNFFHSYLRNNDMATIDALVRTLEKQGLAAAGVVGWPHSSLESVFNAPETDRVRIMLAFTLNLSRPEDRVFLEKQNVHVIGLMTTRDSYDKWAESDRGVTSERVSSSLSSPELNGVTDPIMVATTEQDTATGLTRTMPIDERVAMAASRARRWVDLTQKPNHEKRLVMLYYNNPPGKGNIGASYLNLAPSIKAALETLKADGYRIGNHIPTADQILAMLEKSGRNVELWAPGELTRMLEQGGVTLLPMARYKQWFGELPERFRDSVNERWGPPESSKLMVWSAADGRKYFVIPGIRLENVFLGPQLLRASFEEYTNVQHSMTLPPHHGYVAAYLYYRHQLQADAVIHMGRHGTLEWLPGKNAGQAGWDASEAILGDLPNLNYYIMDGDGEAIQARRRSAAVDISHLTPMIAHTGREERFNDLAKALEQWDETRETSPLLASEYAATALREIERHGLAKQLDLNLKDQDASLLRAKSFIEEMEDATLPLGLPTLGELPELSRQRDGLLAFMKNALQPDEARQLSDVLPVLSTAIVAGERVEVPDSIRGPLREKVFSVIDSAHGWLSRLRESPGRELAALTKVLRGEFLPSGLVGDPLAVPDALPSGRNLHQGDPALWPTRTAWDVGKKLATDLIESHRKRHGHYPERISMVLWQGETGRHQGAMEAQALYLMGVEPVWNSRGAVDGLKLIPDSELGRPRVNVVFTASGLYRDGLAEKIVLLDRAARLAASAGDNALSRQNRNVEQALKSAGIDDEEARELAGARVFATAPGSYGLGLSQFVEQSRDKDEPETMAELYMSKMNYAFSEKRWGASAPKLFENHLRGNEAILHSRSSNLYGAVDNDDVYQWMGGLRVASAVAGATPDMLVNNMRRRGQEKLESARDFIATELNARNWNPRWIKEMQKEGYSGAREMTKAVEYLYGWQATAPDTIAPEVWQKTYDVYVADEYGLGMNEFFDKANPAARQNLVGRLLEVDRQGTYQFSEEQRRVLVREYVRLISQTGVSCSANACGNRRLQTYVMSEARNLKNTQISSADFAKFTEQWQRAFQPRRVSPSTKIGAARGHSLRPALTGTLDNLKNYTIDMTQITESAKRFVEENLVTILLVWLSSFVIGSGMAGIRRVRRGDAILGLQMPGAWSDAHDADKSTGRQLQ